MLKIIIGIIIIYILYNVAKEYKESKKFNEKIEKEKREKKQRILQILEKNRICANCAYSFLDDTYYDLHPYIVKCMKCNDTKMGDNKCYNFDFNGGKVFDIEYVKDFDIDIIASEKYRN